MSRRPVVPILPELRRFSRSRELLPEETEKKRMSMRIRRDVWGNEMMVNGEWNHLPKTAIFLLRRLSLPGHFVKSLSAVLLASGTVL